MLTILSWIVAAPLLAINGVLLVEVTLGLLPARRRARDDDRGGRAITTVVLIPAHDEDQGIGETLRRLAFDLPTGATILVVADNCSDRTADVARALGVPVIERTDPAKRGKGFALAFGRDALRKSPPDVVIVFDADCTAEPGCFDRLSQGAARRDAAVVGCYLLSPSADAPPPVQISGFAMLVKNQIRQSGLSRLGVPAVLTGTGMAFPWRVFEAAPLATDDIVEDLGLGIDLATRGETIVFEREARIWSDPSTEAGTLAQRTRWEKGFLTTAAHRAWPLLVNGVKQGRGALIWLSLHLLVPPIALLVLLDVAAIALLLAMVAIGAPAGPSTVFVAIATALAVALTIAWVRHGQAQLSPRAIWRIPGYLLWKLPIYAETARGGKAEWTRTPRQFSVGQVGGLDQSGQSTSEHVGDDDRAS